MAVDMNPVVTRDQVRRIDKLAVERYGISGIVLMENAGRNAASIIDDDYGPTGQAFICCGPGNNGGDGCVIARHLDNFGWTVRVMLAGDPARLTHDAKVNYGIVEAMGLDPVVTSDLNGQLKTAGTVRGDEIVVDALLGTGFRGEVRSPTAELIHAINATENRSVVAIDLPSGLDCDSGTPSNATVCADLTVTFVAAKVGFEAKSAESYLGRVVVADIGAPRELIEQVLAEQA